MIQNSGTTRLTAAGVLGTAGRAVRIFSITVISDGTAGVTTVRDGSTSGGVVYDIIAGVISSGATRVYGSTGRLFVDGCYIDADSHSIGVIVDWNYAS